MKITYFFRKPQAQYHSIERVFNLVIDHLPPSVESTVYRLKSGERGILSRLKALAEVRRHKGPGNHITGDISYVALALPRKGLVVTFHDLESLQRSSRVKGRLLKWFWVTLPARRAQVVTVISQHTKQQVMEWAGLKAEKIRVIANPLPPGFSKSLKPDWPQRPTVLAVGTKYNKNLEGTIEALKGLKCRLVIVGRLSPQQIDLLEQNRIDYECLTGLTDEQMLEAYRQCDLLCFPSLFEGFGMPIIEAQAIGRPVVTSNYGAMKEVAGEGALLVDPSVIKSIREGLVRVMNDEALRKDLVEKGLKNARRFSPKRVAARYAEVYELKQ